MTTEWPFAERYKEYMMPPTQVREALKRLAKKNVDPATDTEENLHVIKAVHQAYANKKERARAASAKSRATKRVDDCGDALAQDAAVACVTGLRLRQRHPDPEIWEEIWVVDSFIVHPKGHRPDPPPLQGSWGAGKASEPPPEPSHPV